MKKLLLLLLLSVSTLSIGQVVTIKHTAYEIRFDIQIKEPIYTHYVLTKQMLSSGNARTLFHCDKAIPCDQQGNESDYKGSIYDRGHLSPDDDFRANPATEVEAMVYTNCAPQNKYFNRGTWKALEIYTRNLANHFDVEIWTGCIYEGSKEHLGKLLVPTYYWKLIKYNGIYQAYKIPNVTPKSKNFTDYKISSDELLKLIN